VRDNKKYDYVTLALLRKSRVHHTIQKGVAGIRRQALILAILNDVQALIDGEPAPFLTAMLGGARITLQNTEGALPFEEERAAASSSSTPGVNSGAFYRAQSARRASTHREE
jgi:hypothetical protein